MNQLDSNRYCLTEEESRKVFVEKIVPNRLKGGGESHAPVLVLIAGQPGAGKTRTTQQAVAQLNREGGAIVVNSDYYKPFHPEYARLLKEDGEAAVTYTRIDGRRWMTMAERHLAAQKVNTVIETTMSEPSVFQEPIEMFRSHGYSVEIVVMAVPEALSQLGIVSRYQKQVADTGGGRLTSTEKHDEAYANVATGVKEIDESQLVDHITIVKRGNQQLYTNSIISGEWEFPAAAHETLTAERKRIWTPKEQTQFDTAISKLEQQLGPEWQKKIGQIRKLSDPLRPSIETSTTNQNTETRKRKRKRRREATQTSRHKRKH